MEFYKVTAFDKNKNEVVHFFVYTDNINEAIKKIMNESPQVNVLFFKQIPEAALPLVAVVIQK